MYNSQPELDEEPYFPPTDYDQLEAPDEDPYFGDIDEPDDSSSRSSDEPPVDYTPPGVVDQAGIPDWLAAMEIEDESAMPATSQIIEPDVLPISPSWDLDTPGPADEPSLPLAVSGEDWQFLRGMFGSEPSDSHPGVLDAQIVGQTIESENQIRYVISALELYEDHAAELALAEFEDVEAANQFYFGLRDASSDLPTEQLGDFARFATASHAEWQQTDLEQASQQIERIRALDQDVEPPANLDMSSVIDTEPTIRYGVTMASVPDKSSHAVLASQIVSDGRMSQAERSTYITIGHYQTALEAHAVVSGLEKVRQDVAEIVGEGDVRAEQALVSTARAIAVGNGMWPADEHLFLPGIDNRFNDLEAPAALLEKIATELEHNEVTIAEVEFDLDR